MSDYAYPSEFKFGDGTATRTEGLTKQEHYAGLAMQALLVGKDAGLLFKFDIEQICSRAFMVGQEMARRSAL